MFRAGGVGLAGKAGYALSCVLASIVLVASGVGYYAEREANLVGTSGVLAGGPSTGAMNILVMGLESRTYMNGNPLPRSLEDAMHIGDVGGNATNTLILIHIFAGGKKAIGFSIPRDDYVQMYDTLGFGPPMSKIDNAYGYAMAAKMGQLAQTDPSMSSVQRNFEGNEAGRQATVDTVEALTGVTINHFAELNLDGFYELAQEFGGIEVCVKSQNGGKNLTDVNSGADLKVGYQHLDAAQALSFVRERDSLQNGDLDRTHRQQAVLDYVIYKLKHEGLLTDISRLNSLLSFAKNYLITSSGWNLLQFAGEMQSLSGSNLTFQTLPISGQETIPSIGDVNTVNTAAIKAEVQTAFSSPPGTSGGNTSGGKKTSGAKPVPAAPPAGITADVYNAGLTSGLAGQVSQALTGMGYRAGAVSNAMQRQAQTTVTYGSGAAGNAAQIAKDFGVTASPGSSVAAGHVQIVLGGDTTVLPAGLGGSAAASGSPSASAASPASASAAASPSASAAGTGQQGGPVTVAANAPYGIPCVY